MLRHQIDYDYDTVAFSGCSSGRRQLCEKAELVLIALLQRQPVQICSALQLTQGLMAGDRRRCE
jgi:hypothetical protein